MVSLTGLLATTLLLLTGTNAQTTQCKGYPTDTASWPTQAQWIALNSTVGGRLAAVIPPAAVCHNNFNGLNTYNQARCTQVRNGWGQQDFHFNDPVSIMWDYWSNNTCAPTTNANTPCTIGTYPAFVLKATNVADVQAGVNFARERNLRLNIKNTGHDFMGKSTGAGSLSIWTHQFKEMQIINAYSDPSTSYTGPAIKLGSGWQAGDIFKELDKIGRTIVAGECAGVGYSGGYIQGGGHGPLSSLYGMGSDSVLQYTLVTASGQYITADSTQNTDLFWALRGGGGASFGVVISVTVKTYPTPVTSGMTFTLSASAAGGADRFWSAIGAFHAAGPAWVEAGLFGYYELSAQQFSVAPLLAPGKTQQELQALTQPFLNNLRNLGINITPRYHQHSTFLASYNALFTGEGAGASMLTSSRLILKSHIRNNNAAVTNAFRTVVERGGRMVIGHMVGPPAYADSAVNPIWREGVLLPLYNAFIQAGASEAEKQRIIKETNEVYDKAFKDATPGGGGYVNEGNIFDPNWKQEFYGKAYDRLYSIKRATDPTGVFYAKTAVGSELWEERVGGRLCRTNVPV